MLSDTSDVRKVDKRSAISNLDTSLVHGSGPRKKRVDDLDGEPEGPQTDPINGAPGLMTFTMVSRRGGKQQVRFFFPLDALVILR